MVFFHGPLRLSPHTSSREGGDVPLRGDRRGDEGMLGGSLLGPGAQGRAVCNTQRGCVLCGAPKSRDPHQVECTLHEQGPALCHHLSLHPPHSTRSPSNIH